MQPHPSILQGRRGAWGKRLGRAGRGKMGRGPCTPPHLSAISSTFEPRRRRRDSEGLHEPVPHNVPGDGDAAVEHLGTVHDDLEDDNVPVRVGPGSFLALDVADEVLVAQVRGAVVHLGTAPPLDGGFSLLRMASGALRRLVPGPPWGKDPGAPPATMVAGAGRRPLGWRCSWGLRGTAEGP